MFRDKEGLYAAVVNESKVNQASSHNRIYGVKFGGANAENDCFVRHIAEQILTFQKQTGVRVFVDHGGARLIDAALKDAGIEVSRNKKTGRRNTDLATLRICNKVLCGLTYHIADLFNQVAREMGYHDNRAIGLTGSHNGIMAEAISIDPNEYTGRVLYACTKHVSTCLNDGRIAIANSMGLNVDETRKERLLNNNADDAVRARAEGVGAEKIFFCTDVAGVMDGGNVLREISVQQAQTLIDTGIVNGGMIPKVTAGIRAAEMDIEATILDGREKGAILKAMMGEDIGTRIVHRPTSSSITPACQCAVQGLT